MVLSIKSSCDLKDCFNRVGRLEMRLQDAVE